MSDAEALVLLIRGVGTHLDVPTRNTRLQGMRVGEAVANLTGQTLRFAELDAERTEEEEADVGMSDGVGTKERVDGEGGSADSAAVRDGTTRAGRRGGRGRRRKPRNDTESDNVAGRGVSNVDEAGMHRESGRAVEAGPWGGVDDGELDPDMLLPLGGSDSEEEEEEGEESAGGSVLAGLGNTKVIHFACFFVCLFVCLLLLLRALGAHKRERSHFFIAFSTCRLSL